MHHPPIPCYNKRIESHQNGEGGVILSRFMKKIAAGLLAASLLLNTLPAYAREYDDFEEITAVDVDLSTPTELSIAKPTSAVNTTAASYYITGTSDPSTFLTINGVAVEDRGKLGSFGKLVNLVIGKNVFTVNNGGVTKTVTITREKVESGVVKTTKLTAAKPTVDDFALAGEYKLTCTAPSGAKVTAKIAGKTITMEQAVATAEDGVPAVYKGSVTLEAGEYKGVTYTLTFNGNTTTVESVGKLTVFEADATPTVAINQNSTTVYELNDTSSNFVAMLNEGAQDTIVEFGDTLVKLSMGGWVKKEFLNVVEGSPSTLNQITAQSYEVNENGEYLTLQGSVPSVFKAYMNSEKLYIRFYNMKGVTAIPLEDSELFEKAHISSDSNSTTIELYCKEQGNLQGYDVRYMEDGSISIFFNPRPSLGREELPLENITVVVDAGHGGFDPGALGVLNGEGPAESDITMAHALAVQKRLEKLGATVVMSVPKDLSSQKKVVLHERVQITRDAEADYFISLHCNSVGGTANDLKAAGSEVYYYENISRSLSENVIAAIAQGTGRNLRGTYYSNYFVNRNSICPGMLVEMAFVSNPSEYDDLRSAESRFITANAVADAILTDLQK